MRFILSFVLLLIIGAVFASPPVEQRFEPEIHQVAELSDDAGAGAEDLLAVDGQGHENESERMARDPKRKDKYYKDKYYKRDKYRRDKYY